MALIPKVPFVSGSVFTPEVATEMADITFDNQPGFYGHYNKITDTDLSDAPGQLKDRLGLTDLNLKVTAGAGLNANFTAGRALYANTVFTIGASSVTLTASSTNYVYVGINGVVANTTALPPIVRALLAIVTTNTTGVVTVTDTREGYKLEVIKPVAFTVKNFGGRGDSGAYVATNGDTLSDGEYYYTDFTVGAGITITVAKLAKIFVTGNCSILGTINVAQAVVGGAGYVTSVVSGSAPGSLGGGFGAAAGEIAATSYSYNISPVGSGGAGGSFAVANTGNTLLSIATRAGGAGGGCFWLEAAGNITISGSVNAPAGLADSALVSGTSVNGIALGAGNGGSGGLVLLKALGTIVISGTLNVSGSAGGAGVVNTNNVGAESGSGGGGGRIVLAAPNINTTGSTLNISGGAAGASTASGASLIALNGNGGSFGGAGGSGSIANAAGANGIITTRLVSPLG